MLNTEKNSDGTGINNMKESIAKLKGEINILSTPNAGTSIKIMVPLVELIQEDENYD